MRKVKWSVVIGLLFMNLTGCHFLADDPEIPPASTSVIPQETGKSDGNMTDDIRDILPVQPVTSEDILSIIDHMRMAMISGDPEKCDSLPEPDHQVFNFGDYSLAAPSRAEWVAYCIALANNDPELCGKINDNTHPNLRQECTVVMERFRQATTSTP
jgi:hypothetical protein